jgi:hypothetical protein
MLPTPETRYVSRERLNELRQYYAQEYLPDVWWSDLVKIMDELQEYRDKEKATLTKPKWAFADYNYGLSPVVCPRCAVVLPGTSEAQNQHRDWHLMFDYKPQQQGEKP